MNDLKLVPLRCPQCGSAGVVRQGVRITGCDRCGSELCLTRTVTPRYEIEASLTMTGAVAATRRLLDERGLDGDIDRPELVLLPFHEVSGRRVGVFERRVPVQRPASRTLEDDAVHRGMYSTYMNRERSDTKVILSDVEHLTAAAGPPWGLEAFDARRARRDGTLKTFDLADAQRRATVYAEERSASALATDRFARRGARLVGVHKGTLFFPFLVVPLTIDGAEYEVVFDGTSGDPIAWRLPELYSSRRRTLRWALPSVIGALLLGQAIRALVGAPAPLDPVQAVAGAALFLIPGLVFANAPDWRLRRWPIETDRARGEESNADD